MAGKLYIAATDTTSGKSVVTLGVMELLSRRIHRLGFFRPMISETAGSGPDNDIDLIRHRYKLRVPYESLFALTESEAGRLVAEGQSELLLERVFTAFKAVEAECDFIVCEGSDFMGVSSAYELEFNARVAAHLGCPVLIVGTGRRRSPGEMVGSARASREIFINHGATPVATILNRVEPDAVVAVGTRLATDWPHPDPVYVIPEHETIGKPTVREVAEALNAEEVFSTGRGLNREIRDFKVAAMRPASYLEHVHDGSLIITPGDRDDIVLSSLAAAYSKDGPTIAGLVLTGGIALAPAVLRVLGTFRGPRPPIFAVKTDTWDTAMAVSAVRAHIRPGNERKIASALGMFESWVDQNDLEQRIAVARSDRMTPMMFEYELVQRAKADRRHIVLPEGTEPRILRAADILLRRDVVDLTLLGDLATMETRASALGIDISRAQRIDPARSPWHEEYAETFYELRRHKGVTREAARDVLLDVSYFGTMMVHKGAADGMVSGAVHTTSHTVRPALEFIRTQPGCSIVSSVFFMCLEDRVLVYGDCAVNPNPNAEQLAEIALSSADTAEQFGIEPRVAMLSYSTGESGKGAEVDKVREATRIARQRRPDLPLEGPLQYDAAVDEEVARLKLPGSPVAGRATVFIFPDLNTGNNTYKAVQRSANAIAVGPVLQGLNKPVNDLSRGCTVPDIVNTVVITAVQAQAARTSNEADVAAA
jgi:phosphate acetyltransferase